MKGMKTGGRKKGTPNKENPLKGYLRAHSLAYFEPKAQVDEKGRPRVIKYRDKDGAVIEEIHLKDAEGKPLVISDFDVDQMLLQVNERVNAELRLLEFHTPKMKSVDVDMAVQERKTIEDRLLELSKDDEEDQY